MRFRWLGWAGVELQADDGTTLVIDALENPAATFAMAGEAAASVLLPPVCAPTPGRAAAALVTHLHRDHADAGAIAAAVSQAAPVVGPVGPADSPSVRDAAGELADRALLNRRSPLAAWETLSAGPFAITAVPAVDGLGDPQNSYVIEADGVRVFHGGDTMLHGYWWRIARTVGPIDLAFLPVNGAVISFPWLQPPSPEPAAMTPEQAVIAARGLRAATAVPIHYGGFAFPPVYVPLPDAPERFSAAAADASLAVVVPPLGEWRSTAGASARGASA